MEENIQLVVTEKYDPLDDPQFRCDVCKLNFYKRYMSLNGNRKAVEKHMLTRSHKHNVERAEQGLPPERMCNFTNMHGQMQELVDKMTMRIAELETLVKSVTDIPSEPTNDCYDSLENASIADSVDEPRIQTQNQSHMVPSEEKSLLNSSIHQPSSEAILSPHERNVLCEYDGETLSNMRAVHVVLTRLLLRLRDVSYGDKYEKNFQFVSRTINAVSLQLERAREGYTNDEREIDEIAYRLTQIAVHPFAG